MDLKSLRKSKKLTQQEASDITGVPLRTYQNYENEIDKCHSIKYKYLYDCIMKFGFIDETHGVLSIEDIKVEINDFKNKYGLEFILIGDYARNKANDTSYIEMVINGEINDNLVQELKTKLKKEIKLHSIEFIDYNIIKDVINFGIRL